MSDNRPLSALERFKRGGQPLALEQARPAMPGGFPESPAQVMEFPGLTSLADVTLEVEELKSFGLVRGIAGQVYMLDVRQRSGDCEGVPYATINRVSFNRSGEIRIRTGLDVIIIEGSNLERIHVGLLSQSVVYVQELSRQHDLVGENEPFIDAIRIEMGE